MTFLDNETPLSFLLNFPGCRPAPFARAEKALAASARKSASARAVPRDAAKVPADDAYTTSGGSSKSSVS